MTCESNIYWSLGRVTIHIRVARRSRGVATRAEVITRLIFDVPGAGQGPEDRQIRITHPLQERSPTGYPTI